MKSLKSICLLAFTATAIALMPTSAPAQTTNKAAPKPATEAKEKKPVAGQATETKETVKKPVAGPFHGKLAALDKDLKTITVGKRTFHIIAETQIKKAGKLAALAD